MAITDYKTGAVVRDYSIEQLKEAANLMRGRERGLCFRRKPARIAGAKPHHCEPPAHGDFQPGTSTTAKYGAASSFLSASRISAASCMVPRST